MTGKKKNLKQGGVVILYFQLISVTFKKYSTLEKVTRFSKDFYTYIWNLTKGMYFEERMQYYYFSSLRLGYDAKVVYKEVHGAILILWGVSHIAQA